MAAHKWPLTEQLRLVDNVLTIDLLLACLVPLLDATREPAKNSLLPTLVTGFVQALAAVGGHPEHGHGMWRLAARRLQPPA